MSLGSEAAQEIVWPEDLLDADSSVSVEDRAVSQSPDGRKGLHSGSEQNIPKNESQTASDFVDVSSTNEHWDHDDRNTDGSILRYVSSSVLSCVLKKESSTFPRQSFHHSVCSRSFSPANYVRSEEDTDKWMHDKFDLLKVYLATISGRYAVLHCTWQTSSVAICRSGLLLVLASSKRQLLMPTAVVIQVSYVCFALATCLLWYTTVNFAHTLMHDCRPAVSKQSTKPV